MELGTRFKPIIVSIAIVLFLAAQEPIVVLAPELPDSDDGLPNVWLASRFELCGHVSAESRRSQALFVCVRCDYAIDADTNAARNILRRAELPARSAVLTRKRSPAASCVIAGAEPALGTAA
jgi:hypothetical protein